jgi:cyclophilin family peptidyl-prolyl cis-trans isomerase/HEAT repeat protein
MHRTGTLALLVFLLVLSACAARSARVIEATELAAEIAEADAALAALTTDDALLRIARHQDARRDVMELYPLRTHTDPVVRAAATRAMGLIGDPDAAGAIAGSLRDTDPRVRSAAAFALSQMSTWRTTSVEGTTGPVQGEQWLLDALEEELEEPERMAAPPPPDAGPTAAPSPLRALARALGELGQDDGAKALWGLIGDAALASEVRAEALLSLGIQARRKVAEPELTDAEIAVLAPLIIEKRPAVQWPAAYLISRAGVTEEARAKADGILAVAWKSAEDADVRAWILRAIGKVGGPSTVEVLASVGEDAPLRERVSAGRGASAAGEVALPLLLAFLEDPDASVRDEAAGALGRSDADDALAALLARPDHSAAVSALGGFVGSEETPASADRLKTLHAAAVAGANSEDPKLRQAAYGLLSALPGQEALDVLLARVTVTDGATTTSEADSTAALYLALALAERTEPAVEGALLGWLSGEDTLLGAVAADGLAKREGAHIGTRLSEAYLAFPEPKDAERRLSIVKALVEREDTPGGLLLKAMVDPDGLVREVAVAGVQKSVRLGKSQEAPKLRDFPDLPDARWGMGGVTGAVVSTPHGDITLELFTDVAPGTVANFVTLAESGYFDGLVFHRVVPDFVIQGGDPLGNGWGGPGHTIRCEYNQVDYERGVLGMALSGKDTGGSQWFITHTAQPHLTGHYTVFGRMTDGWDVLDAARVGDGIDKVTILRD